MNWRINQVWSSDITYYEVGGIFYYLTFILDNYTRKIIGHSVSGRLTTEHTSLPAIKKAISMTGKDEVVKSRIIFHSDGGGQYYDKKFLELTRKYNFQNSMCEYAYENGKAERVNGVIKNNYLVFCSIETLDQLVKEVDRVVNLYNNEKPHKGLHYKTPSEFEKMCLYLQANDSELASVSIKAMKKQLQKIE
ncbi:MAG: DDE-type integrase/transposase/recombinase [Saprospiraceae bacterium]|nr:DDE-type integrase/transposase/recombinase [Saprospiraceae bacterium]